MRFALFSDIHGNLTGLRAVLKAIDSMGGADIRIAAGDLVSGESGTDEIIALLEEHQVVSVQGDSDTRTKLIELEAKALAEPGSTRSPDWFYRETREWLEAHLSPEGRAYLDALPLSRTLEAAPGQSLYVCHASPRGVGDRVCAPFCPAETVREAFASVDAQIIAFGHAHEAHVRLLDGRPFVNVAAVGFQPEGLARLTILDYTNHHWQIFQHCIPFDYAAQEALNRKCGVPSYP